MAAVEEEEPGGAAFTCRFTAALRHVEGTLIEQPLLTDPLAPFLCGEKALALARQELSTLQADQGPGKHLRVPARTRLVDDQISLCLEALSQQQSTAKGLQIVSLGCGMDTRPWRLQTLQQHPQVSWFDVDQPEVAALKLAGLAAAGAQTTSQPPSAAVGGAAAGPAFPLGTASYYMAGADLAVVPLKHVLLPQGFDVGKRTIWVLEAVIYYLPLVDAGALLQAMAELSSPGSQLICTCVDQELLEASHSRMASTHIFANLWHFDHHDLTSCEQFSRHWVVGLQPRSTRDLALASLAADTYVALYGGAECLLVAERMQ